MFVFQLLFWHFCFKQSKVYDFQYFTKSIVSKNLLSQKITGLHILMECIIIELLQHIQDNEMMNVKGILHRFQPFPDYHRHLLHNAK